MGTLSFENVSATCAQEPGNLKGYCALSIKLGWQEII